MRKWRDPIGVVEAAYDFRAPEPLWVERMVEAARPILDDGCGVLGFTVDLKAPDGEIARSPVALGGSASWRRRWRPDWWARFVEPMPRDLLTRLVMFAPVAYVSIAADAVRDQIDTLPQYLELLASRGVSGDVFGRPLAASGPSIGLFFPDAFALQAIDSSGHGVVLAANRATPAKRPPSRADMRAWNRVVSHIAAAHRIRRRLAGRGPMEGAEVILSPRGRVVHAEGNAVAPEALEMLRSAALGMDRARTAKVRATDDALEMWRALHDGRWSVVDTFDTDGRRFLIARANEPAAAPAPSLSRREQQVLDLLSLGHSNKLIAYDLGISVSSVATHLRRAATKLRLQSTRDLVRWARARRRPDEGDEGARGTAE